MSVEVSYLIPLSLIETKACNLYPPEALCLQTMVHVYLYSNIYQKVFLITIESPIGAGELHIRPDDYMQVKCQKNEVYEAFAGDNVSVEFNEEKEIVATKKVQLTMPGEYLK